MKTSWANLVATVVTTISLLLATTGLANATESEIARTSSGSRTHSVASTVEFASSPDFGCPASDAEGLKFKTVSAKTSKELLSRTQDLLDRSQVRVFAAPSLLLFDSAKVYALPTSEGTYHSVTIPITSSVPISNFTVVYAPDDRVSNYAETQIEKTGEGFIKIAQWINGNRSLDKTEYVGELDFDSSRSGNTSTLLMAQSWGKAVACLAAVLGVSASVAAVVLSLCGGSCAVPEPTFSKAICAACIGGIVTLGGSSITGVTKCFEYW